MTDQHEEMPGLIDTKSKSVVWKVNLTTPEANEGVVEIDAPIMSQDERDAVMERFTVHQI